MILTGRSNRIAGQFQLISDGQKVRRLQPAVDQLASVQEGQRVHDRRQQFLHFLGVQGPAAQDLGERLIAMFHHDKQIVLPLDLPPANLEKLHQVRMGQVDCRLPPHQQGLRLRRIRPNEFDRGLGQVLGLVLGEEHRPLVRPAQATAQNEAPLDDLALPSGPGVGECCLARFRAHLCCIRRPRRLDSSRPPAARRYSIRSWRDHPCSWST